MRRRQSSATVDTLPVHRSLMHKRDSTSKGAGSVFRTLVQDFILTSISSSLLLSLLLMYEKQAEEHATGDAGQDEVLQGDNP